MASDAPSREPGADGLGAPPWFLRGAELLRWSPLGLGLASAALLVVLQVAAWLGLQRVLDQPPAIGETELRPMLFFAVLIAFTPAAVAHCARRLRRDLEDLEPVLTLDAGERRRGLARMEHVPLGRFLAVAGAFQLLAFVAMEANIGRISTVLSAERTPFDVYIVAMSFLVIGSITAPVLVLLQVALGFRQLGWEHARVELFELGRLEPFGRIGVRAALISPLVMGLAMLLGTGVHLGAVVGATVFVGVLSGSLLLLPSLGVRRRVAQAKAAEEARVARALRGEPGALDDSPIGHEAERLRMVDLLAYRAMVADLREWPIAYGQWRRVGVYMLIPLATWTAKALVERIVGSLLG